MKPIAEMTMPELAAYVCAALEAEGIETVLSGGCCVEIYSSGRYTSDDIDLIDRFNGGHRRIKRIMNNLGFREHNIRRYFIHEESRYFIEFPRGPLGVGDEPVEVIARRDYCTGSLKLLTPTDCVKDRLAAFYHWDDRQSLEQAVWVAQAHHIEWEKVERWSLQEGAIDKFRRFRSLVESGQDGTLE